MSIFVVAEIGINHNGDMQICKELIDISKESGCDAVKFQKRDIDKVYTKEFLSSNRESPWGTTQRDQKEGLELGNGYISREQYDDLPSDTVTLQWTAEKDKTPVDSNGFFNDLGDEEKVEVRAFYWSKPISTAEYFDYQTIICILFGVDQNSINEGINLIENVR